MKPTKFLIPALLFSLFLIASQAYSQQSKFTPEDLATRMTDNLTKNLDLTTDQQGQVHDIVLNYATAHDRTNFSRDDLNALIEPVLTDDQKVKFKDLQEKMKNRQK